MILCLAPMDGITDCAFRLITREVFEKYNSTDELFLFTEFMSSQGFIRKPEGVAEHLLKTDNQHPVFAQIFGGDIDSLRKTVMEIQELREFDGVDLNMGCPSSKIAGVGGGAGMLKDRDNALSMIKQLSEATENSFSIKTRIGLKEEDKNEQFQFLAQAAYYCDFITVHGRTLNQGHSGETDREFVYRLREKVSDKTRVFFNGGVESYEEAYYLKDSFDGIMIGRASVGNPWIFTGNVPDFQETRDVVLRHLDMAVALEKYFYYLCQDGFILRMPSIEELKKITLNFERDCELKTPLSFRKHLFAYIKGLKGSKEFKRTVNTIRDYETLRTEIGKYFDELIFG